MIVFTSNKNVPRNSRPAKSDPMLLSAVISKVIRNFLIRCMALSQNIWHNGQMSAQIRQNITVYVLTIQIVDIAWGIEVFSKRINSAFWSGFWSIKLKRCQAHLLGLESIDWLLVHRLRSTMVLLHWMDSGWLVGMPEKRPQVSAVWWWSVEAWKSWAGWERDEVY